MSKAKKQHYVPRFYLKYFATIKNSEYFTHCFDKSDLSENKVNIKDIGCENYFYGASKQSSQKLEWVLADFDSKFTKVYNKLITKASLNYLDWKDKEIFAQFITIQELRTREMREHLRATANELKSWLSKKSAPEKMQTEASEVSSERGIRDIQSKFITETLSGKNDLVQMLLDLKWCLFENNTGVPFWTSDHPVNRYNSVDSSPYGNLGTLCSGIEIYFPLTPKLIISFCDPIKYFFIPEKAQCEKENVHFYNNLQLSANTRHIFSVNADFSIAKKWVTEYPTSKPLDRKRISTQFKKTNSYSNEDFSYDPVFRYIFREKYRDIRREKP